MLIERSRDVLIERSPDMLIERSRDVAIEVAVGKWSSSVVEMDHYTHYPSFESSLVAFTQTARDYGYARGLDCSQDTIKAALTGIWWDIDIFSHALTALYCKDESEVETFLILFNRFWRQKGTRLSQKRDMKNQTTLHKQAKNTAVMTGLGTSDKSGQATSSKTTSGANAKEALKSTDFSKLTFTQTEELDLIAEQLVREMSLRIKRKRKKAKTGAIDLRSSIRKNLQNGGNIVDLQYADRKKEKLRLLILLDVSGSMDKYSYFLLKFLWSLRMHFRQIEAFSFSTTMMRITELIDDADAAIAFSKVSQQVDHWSSGTKIGECLADFNDNYASRYLNGKTLTIVMSDGLDTGPTEVLEEQITQLKRRSKKLVWLNPLKGMIGYQPIQKGIKAVLPSVDIFESAHNFDSLLQLENILADA